MLPNRFVNGFLSLSLVTLAALTVGQAVATAQVMSSGGAGPSTTVLSQPVAAAAYPNCPWSLAELRSMQFVYVKELNRWELQINHMPLGVDGGLSALGSCPPRALWAQP